MLERDPLLVKIMSFQKIPVKKLISLASLPKEVSWTVSKNWFEVSENLRILVCQ